MKRLTEKKWKYTINDRNAYLFRQAIEAEEINLEDVVDAMMRIYKEIYRHFDFTEEDDLEDLESLQNDLSEVDDLDDMNVYLNDLYDFCDNMDVFIPIEWDEDTEDTDELEYSDNWEDEGDVDEDEYADFDVDLSESYDTNKDSCDSDDCEECLDECDSADLEECDDSLDECDDSLKECDKDLEECDDSLTESEDAGEFDDIDKIELVDEPELSEDATYVKGNTPAKFKGSSVDEIRASVANYTRNKPVSQVVENANSNVVDDHCSLADEDYDDVSDIKLSD